LSLIVKNSPCPTRLGRRIVEHRKNQKNRLTQPVGFKVVRELAPDGSFLSVAGKRIRMRLQMEIL
jgi:hypothetical protein